MTRHGSPSYRSVAYSSILDRGHAFAPNPFVWEWAQQQETPTAEAYKPDPTRQRPWQVRVDLKPGRLVQSGRTIEGIRASAKAREEIRRARKVAFNLVPEVAVELIEGESVEDLQARQRRAKQQLRRDLKVARRWRRAKK